MLEIFKELFPSDAEKIVNAARVNFVARKLFGIVDEGKEILKLFGHLSTNRYRFYALQSTFNEL